MIGENILTEVLGAKNVDRSLATLEAFSKDMSFVSPVRPAGVVKVQNLEQVRKLVKLARETQTPLIPVSSGPPHFRGDTVPTTGGAIIVDMSDMKKSNAYQP